MMCTDSFELGFIKIREIRIKIKEILEIISGINAVNPLSDI